MVDHRISPEPAERRRAAHGRDASPAATDAAAGGRAGRRKARRKRGRARRVVLLSLAVVLVLLVGGGSYVYFQLDGNIKSSALFTGTGTQAPEKKDAAGNSPENILVIGSDTRSSATDCQIGGDCGGGGAGANADVEMLVHLSANRTNATVLSIPRDTVTDLPDCKDPTTGAVHSGDRQVLINSSLQYGPGCTVAAVHQLTGITVDHFMMIDFGGVVNMSDAVGGVNVCVDNNVYDPYSHLKLTSGSHTLQGLSALEFLRTRHGFGNGSDLGREGAQHLFLSAMIQKLKSANTLTNPAALYSLANAATKALTVDTALDGITNLTSLAGQLNDVPTNKITFLTTPNLPYQGPVVGLKDDVVLGPDAQQVFTAIQNDQSFSGGTPSASPSAPSAAGRTAPAPATSAAPAAPAIDTAAVHLDVSNASATSGRALAVATVLQQKGYTDAVESGNAAPVEATELVYAPSHAADAQAVASTLGLPSSALRATGTSATLHLYIGSDWPSGTSFGGTTTAASGSAAGAQAPAPTAPVAAPSDASADNAGGSQSCAHVSTEDTTPFGSPTKAFAENPKVPNSAP
ncbi:LCP family protein [Kitasatospora sp. NBC_01302]|uniref:LCP family protein n=1 Tax=Kitasatospora sp. NBC_01302 TaxID=2903575 RepID=UPI002E141719|nr:LCP family protein [Kitasatospora sp. NBC_01302]